MFFRLLVLIFLLIFATQVFSVIPFGYKYYLGWSFTNKLAQELVKSKPINSVSLQKCKTFILANDPIYKAIKTCNIKADYMLYTKDQKPMLLVTAQMTIPFGYNLISLFGVKDNFLVGYVSNNSLENF